MTDKLMRSVSVNADLSITIVETPAPTPLDDEIIVAPIAGGICGTDLHIVKGEFPQAVFPVVPCHEFAGTVIAVGRSVTRFREGDLVTADPNVSCGVCRWCLMSRPNLCVKLAVIGVTRPGAAAELVASRLIERRPGVVTEAYTTGSAHRMRRLSEYLTLGGAVMAVSVARRSRVAAAAAGLALLSGSALQRFGTFSAGVASTEDPKYVVVPQRMRLEAAERGRAADSERPPAPQPDGQGAG